MFEKYNLIILNVSKLLIGLILFSFIGVRHGCSEGDSELFVKNKPNFKFDYYLPRGYFEPLESLSAKEREEYNEYVEIVRSHRYHKVLDKLLTFIIILVSVLMVSGIVGVFMNKKTNEIKLLLLDYFMQISLALFLAGLSAISPYHKILPADERFYLLIFLLFAVLFDYLIRKELTKNMQKQQIQQDAKAT